MQNEALLQNLYDTSPMMIGIVNIENNDLYYIKANKTSLNLFGKEEVEMVNHFASEIGVSKDVIDVWINHLKAAEALNKPVDFEYKTIKESGLHYYKATSSFLGEGEEGKKYYAYMSEDITETKEAVLKINCLYSELNSIFEATTEVIIISTNLNFTITQFNRGAERLLGYSSEEVIGKLTPLTFHLKEEIETIERELSNKGKAVSGIHVFEEFQSASKDYTYIRKDGSYFPVNLVVTPKLDGDGKTIGYLGVAMDITKIKNAEKIIKQSEVRFKKLFTLSPVAFVLKDAKTNKYVDFNEAFLHDIGYSREEIISLDNNQIASNSFSDLDDTLLEIYQATGRYGPFEKVYVRKDGSTYTALINGVNIKDAYGEDLIWCVVQNIEDLKDKENQLLELAKKVQTKNETLATVNKELEKFAYVASHDLQEPLRMITGFIGLLEKKYANHLDDTAKKYLDFIVEGAKRMRNIITDILEYSRQSTAEVNFEEVDLNSLIKEIAPVFIAEKEPIPVIEYPELPVITAQKTGLQQLFSNLIGNAIKYQPKGNQPIIKIDVDETETAWQFAVSDNGIGIPQESYEKVFEVFQRLHSKEEYSGTGIGLSICMKVIQRHNGEIWIEPSPLGGTSFHFTIKKTLEVN